MKKSLVGKGKMSDADLSEANIRELEEGRRER